MGFFGIFLALKSFRLSLYILYNSEKPHDFLTKIYPKNVDFMLFFDDKKLNFLICFWIVYFKLINAADCRAGRKA